MDDYKEIMKDLLLQYYSPTPDGQVLQLYTRDLLSWFRGIIPSKPIDEHDVFEILNLAGFRSSQKILTERLILNLKDVEQNQEKPITQEVETGRVLVWNLYEKT